MRGRRKRDLLAAVGMRCAVCGINLLALAVAAGLAFKARPILGKTSLLELLLSSDWRPLKGCFGLFPFIVGTIEVTFIALLIAVPVCLLSAVYLAEYARRRLRETIRPVIEVLAGIPSVIYGLFGILVIVPAVRRLGSLCGTATTGYSLLAGGVILAVMVFPIIIAVSLDVLQSVPLSAREAAIALGATRWETVKHVVLRIARPGILAAVGLGFSRAFGETMAVMMVVGNVPRVPGSLFDPAYPLPALIANNYGEMMSIPLYDAALMTAALILLLVVAVISVATHTTLIRLSKGGRR